MKSILKKRNALRVLFVLMSLIMVVGAIPAQGFADTSKEEAPENVKVEKVLSICNAKDSFRDLGIRIPKGGVGKTHPTYEAVKWYWRGDYAKETKKLDEARKYFRKAARGKRFYPEAHLALAELALMRGQFAQASKHWMHVLRRDYPAHKKQVEKTVQTSKEFEESEVGKTFFKKKEKLENRWRCALRAGIPIVWWEGFTEAEAKKEYSGSEVGIYEYGWPKELRAGVYFLKGKNFLAAGTPKERAYVAWYFQNIDQVVQIKAYRSKEYFSTLTDVDMEVENGLGDDKLIINKELKRKLKKQNCALQIQESDGRIEIRFDANVSEHEIDCQRTKWMPLSEPNETHTSSAPLRSELFVYSEGSIWTHQQKGYDIKGRELIKPDGKKIPLNWAFKYASFRNFIKLGTNMWVTAIWEGCGAPLTEEDATETFGRDKLIFTHFINFIEKMEQSKLVDKGKQTVALQKVSSKNMLLQRGKELFLIRGQDQQVNSSRHLPQGLLIQPPLLSPKCLRDWSIMEW